jgi:proteic killer suppression protein
VKRLHEDDDPRGVIAEHADKLRDILARLDAILTVADMDVPGLRLHPLKGREKGFWAVTVRANWRVIFRFADDDAFDGLPLKRRLNRADEEPTPPRRLCATPVR